MKEIKGLRLRSLAVFAVPLVFAAVLMVWPVPLAALEPAPEACTVRCMTAEGGWQERTPLPGEALGNLRCSRRILETHGPRYRPGELTLTYGSCTIALTADETWVYRREDGAAYRLVGENPYDRLLELTAPE